MPGAIDIIRRHNATAAFLVAFIGALILFLIKRARSSCSHTADHPSPVKASSKHTYATVFPPTQRGVLAEIAPQLCSADFVDLAQTPRPLLPFEADYRVAEPWRFSFSGYSVAEIRALGDFPDYAALSGVPLPTPVVDFDIDQAVARPYRPLRWPYHQTMSLSKMEPDFWIELESSYRDRLKQRQELYQQRGAAVLQTLPGSELACKELMEMVVQFICARYPKQFELLGTTTLVNHVLGTQTDVCKTAPLQVLMNNVPEDFGIMLRHPDTGLYSLRAGLICSTVGWDLNDKIGLGLPGIHGPVPDYKEKMQFSMDR